MPANSFHLHILYRRWADNLLKKNLINLWGISALKVEVKSLHDRNEFSKNRKGVTAFAIFLLSFFCRNML